MRLLSGEKATNVTKSECPTNGFPTGLRVLVSHNDAVLSKEPDAMKSPSGEKVTEFTIPECPRSGWLVVCSIDFGVPYPHSIIVCAAGSDEVAIG